MLRTILATSLLLCALSACKSTSSNTLRPYPMTTCIVSGEPLDAMGDPVVVGYRGQEIKFCCEKCVDKFNADPEAYLAKLSK